MAEASALFPVGMVDPIADRLDAVLNANPLNEPDFVPPYTVIKRSYSPLDPSRSVCIFPANWTASEDEMLIGQRTHEPILQQYRLTIQNVVIHGDSEAGRRDFAMDAKAIRAILYRDAAMHVALAELRETFMGFVEQVKKWKVLRQDFASTRAGEYSFLYLAKTDIEIETETRKVP